MQSSFAGNRPKRPNTTVRKVTFQNMPDSSPILGQDATTSTAGYLPQLSAMHINEHSVDLDLMDVDQPPMPKTFSLLAIPPSSSAPTQMPPATPSLSQFDVEAPPVPLNFTLFPTIIPTSSILISEHSQADVHSYANADNNVATSSSSSQHVQHSRSHSPTMDDLRSHAHLPLLSVYKPNCPAPRPTWDDPPDLGYNCLSGVVWGVDNCQSCSSAPPFIFTSCLRPQHTH